MADFEVERVSDEEARRSQRADAPAWVEGSDAGEHVEKPTGATEEEINAAAEQAAERAAGQGGQGDGQGGGGDASQVDGGEEEIDLGFGEQDRLSMAEQRAADLEAELAEIREQNRRLQESVTGGGGQGGAGRGGSGQPTGVGDFVVTAEIQSRLDDPETHPDTKAFLQSQVNTQRLLHETLADSRRNREAMERRDQQAAHATQVNQDADRVSGIVDGLINRHPILSNGDPDNKTVAAIIKDDLIADYRSARQQGVAVADRQVLPAFQKLLVKHKKLLKTKKPKPPKDPSDRVSEAIARKEAAGRETNIPAGGSAGSTSSKPTAKDEQRFWDSSNKKRFSGVVEKYRNKNKESRRAAGVTSS